MIALADLRRSSAATSGSRGSRTSCSRTSRPRPRGRRGEARRARPPARRGRAARRRDRLHRRAALQLLGHRDEDAHGRPRAPARGAASATDADGLRLHLDGCPHACAQHWVGDLGFQGTTVRDENGKRRAGLRHLPARRRSTGRRRSRGRSSGACRREELDDAVSASSRAGSPARAEGETFRSFCDRTTDDELGRSRARAGRSATEGGGMSTSSSRRSRGGRAVGRVRGRGAGGRARVGDRALLAEHLDLDRVPDRRRRPPRHGLRDRPGDPDVQRRHRSPAAGDVRADRADARPLPRLAARPALARGAAPSTRW